MLQNKSKKKLFYYRFLYWLLVKSLKKMLEKKEINKYQKIPLSTFVVLSSYTLYQNVMTIHDATHKITIKKPTKYWAIVCALLMLHRLCMPFETGTKCLIVLAAHHYINTMKFHLFHQLWFLFQSSYTTNNQNESIHCPRRFVRSS